MAWDRPQDPDPRIMDVPRYRRLLSRAVITILEPIVGTENALTAISVRQLSFILN